MKKISILVLIFCCCVYGCSVYQEDIETAEQLCKDNGGIEFIDPSCGSPAVKCVNGAYFNASEFK